MTKLILFPLARSAEIFEYSVVILAEMVMNRFKNREEYAKAFKNREDFWFFFTMFSSISSLFF